MERSGMRDRRTRISLRSIRATGDADSINLEQSGCAHAAADAHGDDAVLGAAPLALDQDVAGHARPRHAVGMADGDGAAVDVEALVGDAEPIPAIQYLDGEGFVEFPDVDVVHLEPVLLEQLRHGEYRPDAHLVGVAAGDRDAAIGAERIEAAALGFLGLHQHGRGGAVGELRSVAGGDEFSFLDALAVLEHGFQAAQVVERGLWPVALVGRERDLALRGLPAGLVGDGHDARQRHDLGVEPPVALPLRCALLRLERILVLRLTADVVAFRDDFGGLEHGHVDRGNPLPPHRILTAPAVDMFVLDQRDGLEPAPDGDFETIDHDLLGGGRNRHEARRALAIDAHAGNRGRQAGAHRALPGSVAAARPLLQGGTHDDIADRGRVDLGAFHGFGDDVPAQLLGLRIVERAAIGLADRGARGRDDDGFAHGFALFDCRILADRRERDWARKLSIAEGRRTRYGARRPW